MALLDDMKLALRVTAPEFDGEVEMLIASAFADMERVGIDASKLDAESPDPLVRMAVYCWCKARFGFDNDDAAAFDASYRSTVTDMLNSSDYNPLMGGAS